MAEDGDVVVVFVDGGGRELLPLLKAAEVVAS
jgi:hypothetical protein